jgi:hypothetical protein
MPLPTAYPGMWHLTCDHCRMGAGLHTPTCKYRTKPVVPSGACAGCGLREGQHETYCGAWVPYEERPEK